MNILPSLFLNNAIVTEIESFCASDPEFMRAQQEFYKITDQIETLASPDLYDAFEKGLWAYLYRTADLYYLYGLGLRQEILQTLGTGG
ncbi:hypothetical protein D1641_10470 [Colidextribacter sp. OB.20]|uniref:hypothetical protein n=1 Tax=Colidextribacter sp. OB.20 TaxID=2304568 RepID=UPI00136864D0|nr:hypothetical protein [Colidextribacter sp. OB.20]NBI10430.1 hypothetical protein [Colidextribacter sp. OB.20]